MGSRTQADLPTATPPLACRHCGAPIVTRAALVVAGRGLLPFHAPCYRAHARQQPWYRKPGWPVNRLRSLLPFNALVLAPVLALHLLVRPIPASQWPRIALLLLVANGWQLLARLVSYVSLERRLVRHGRARVGETRPAAQEGG